MDQSGGVGFTFTIGDVVLPLYLHFLSLKDQSTAFKEQGELHDIKHE